MTSDPFSVILVRRIRRCTQLVTVEPLLAEEAMSSAKGSGSETGSTMPEIAASHKSDSKKLEPEIVRMLVGLMVATGVIVALVLLS